TLDPEVRVSLAEAHLLEAQAKPAGDEPAKRRGVALAGRLNAGAQLQNIAAGKDEACAFDRPAAGVLDEAAEADAPMALAPLTLALPLGEAIIVGEGECLVEYRLE